MGGLADRPPEQICVGFYLLVASLSAAVYIGIPYVGGPSRGVQLLGISTIWVYLYTVVATALIVLLVNVNRWIKDTSSDSTAIFLASTILFSLCGVIYLTSAANNLELADAVGFVGLILVPLGLVPTVFDLRLRQRFVERAGQKTAIAGVVLRHIGVIAGCILFVPLLYGLAIVAGVVNLEATGHSPGIGMAFMLMLPITFPPPILVIVASLLIPGETPRSVIPRIVVTRGLSVGFGVAGVVVGPYIGLVVWWVSPVLLPGLPVSPFLLVPWGLGILLIFRGTEIHR